MRLHRNVLLIILAVFMSGLFNIGNISAESRYVVNLTIQYVEVYDNKENGAAEISFQCLIDSSLETDKRGASATVLYMTGVYDGQTITFGEDPWDHGSKDNVHSQRVRYGDKVRLLVFENDFGSINDYEPGLGDDLMLDYTHTILSSQQTGYKQITFTAAGVIKVIWTIHFIKLW